MYVEDVPLVNGIWLSNVFFLMTLCGLCDVPAIVSEEEMLVNQKSCSMLGRYLDMAVCFLCV